MEYKFLQNRNYITETRKLRHVYRYLDDILVFDVPKAEFEEILTEIYPASLPATHSSGNNQQCAFLDLDIRIQPSFKITVYDKTRDFNFTVVKFISASSCAPQQLGYNMLFSQLVRFARICSLQEDFASEMARAFASMRTNGFDHDKLITTFFRFAKNYSNLLLKFGLMENNQIVNFAAKL